MSTAQPPGLTADSEHLGLKDCDPLGEAGDLLPQVTQVVPLDGHDATGNLGVSVGHGVIVARLSTLQRPFHHCSIPPTMQATTSSNVNGMANHQSFTTP